MENIKYLNEDLKSEDKQLFRLNGEGLFFDNPSPLRRAFYIVYF